MNNYQNSTSLALFSNIKLMLVSLAVAITITVSPIFFQKPPIGDMAPGVGYPFIYYVFQGFLGSYKVLWGWFALDVMSWASAIYLSSICGAYLVKKYLR